MNIPIKTLKTGESIPTLGLGTWLMGGDTSPLISSQDASDIKLIQKAIENGFCHIDTAELYGGGHTEELVRTAIAPFDRTTLFLASKATKGHHTKSLLSQSLDASLQRLGTDYLDMYYLHQPSLDTPFEETANALNAAYRSGKIKHVGVCNFSAAHFETLQSYLEPKIIANQLHYNLSFREPEHSGLIHHARSHDYFMIAWRPLKLVKRNTTFPLVSNNIWEKGVFPMLDQMALRYEATNVQIALAWVTYNDHVVTLVKSSNIDHLLEAAHGVSINLSQDDHRLLSQHFSPQFIKSDTVPIE